MKNILIVCTLVVIAVSIPAKVKANYEACRLIYNNIFILKQARTGLTAKSISPSCDLLTTELESRWYLRDMCPQYFYTNTVKADYKKDIATLIGIILAKQCIAE